ncbi:MAG: PEP-CTERM sorting domain-containing protein, partial [Planctomycetales bacterium]
DMYNPNPDSGGLMPYPDGTRTAVYTALTPLNEEFINIATQCQSMELELIGSYLKGYSTTTSYNGPPGTTTLPGDSPFTISGVSDTRHYSEGDPLEGVLFGFFDVDGTSLADATFTLIVNLDYSASKNYMVTGPDNLSVFDATIGVWTPMGHDNAMLNLLPGGGILVGLTSSVPVPEPSASILLMCMGLIGLLGYAWKKGRRS